MKYIVLIFFFAVSLILMGVGVDTFVSILAGFGLVVLVGIAGVLVIRFENEKMHKLNKKMMETKNMDGYVEAMEKIGRRTIWMNIYQQTLLLRIPVS